MSDDRSELTGQQEPVKRRRRGRGCLITLFVLVGIIAVVGGGGYWAVSSGRMSLVQLQNRIEGVGSISIYNLSDDLVRVRVSNLDDPDEIGQSESIESFDISAFGSLPTGRNLVDFEASDQRGNASCSILLDRGDSYVFVVVPEGIAVTSDGVDQETADDLDIATSEVCRR